MPLVHKYYLGVIVSFTVILGSLDVWMQVFLELHGPEVYQSRRKLQMDRVRA